MACVGCPDDIIYNHHINHPHVPHITFRICMCTPSSLGPWGSSSGVNNFSVTNGREMFIYTTLHTITKTHITKNNIINRTNIIRKTHTLNKLIQLASCLVSKVIPFSKGRVYNHQCSTP